MTVESPAKHPVAVVEAQEKRTVRTKSAPGKLSTQRRLNCTTLLFYCRFFFWLSLCLCLPTDFLTNNDKSAPVFLFCF